MRAPTYLPTAFEYIQDFLDRIPFGLSLFHSIATRQPLTSLPLRYYIAILPQIFSKVVTFFRMQAITLNLIVFSIYR